MQRVGMSLASTCIRRRRLCREATQPTYEAPSLTERTGRTSGARNNTNSVTALPAVPSMAPQQSWNPRQQFLQVRFFIESSQLSDLAGKTSIPQSGCVHLLCWRRVGVFDLHHTAHRKQTNQPSNTSGASNPQHQPQASARQVATPFGSPGHDKTCACVTSRGCCPNPGHHHQRFARRRGPSIVHSVILRPVHVMLRLRLPPVGLHCRGHVQHWLRMERRGWVL